MAAEIPDSFRVEFTASPEVETRALFNDEPVELRLERTLIKEEPAFLSEISPDYELDWQRLDSVDQTVGPPPHVTVIDPETGEATSVKLFVAAMGASNYTYAEAVASEGLEDWIRAHVVRTAVQNSSTVAAG